MCYSSLESTLGLFENRSAPMAKKKLKKGKKLAGAKTLRAGSNENPTES